MPVLAAYIALMNTRSQNGFTLYEILITLLIVGVVMTLGLPNLTAFTQNSRVTTTANDLLTSLYLARSEAARSKNNITVCSSDEAVLPRVCNGTFDDGWIIFVDSNNPAAVRDVLTENLLRAYPAIDADIDILTNGGATYFSFAGTGLGRGNVNGTALQTARICDSRGNIRVVGDNDSAARVLIITPIGRGTVLRDVARITDQGGCP